MLNSTPLRLSASIERWPIAGSFAISRGAKTEAVVVVAMVSGDGFSGRGECVPYGRYGETPESVKAAIEAMAPGLERHALQAAMPPGAARNAVDCALWDLEAKRSSRPAYEIAGLPVPQPQTTAFTISLGSAADMAAAAEKASERALLKIKLGGADDADPARIAAVRRAAPNARLVVDANEGWNADTLARNIAACADAGVVLIEQPLPAGQDEPLASLKHAVPICADESVHDRASLAALAGRYDAVNIKLDKTGGLTEALAMAEDAYACGFAVMAGCMVGTSLAMAPAMFIAQSAAYTDLDGPLLLARDRDNGLRYDGSLVYPAEPALWG